MTKESRVADSIRRLLGDPVYFWEILSALKDTPYRSVLNAWSDIRETSQLERDIHGRYWLSKNQNDSTYSNNSIVK